MSNTSPYLNTENDDSVIAIDSPQEKRPFARNKLATRSVPSDQLEGGNGARRLSLTQPCATSIDSDDSSHIPGLSKSDAPRRRRPNSVVRGVHERSRNNQPSRTENEIQTLSSSSEVEEPNSARIPQIQKRRTRKASIDVTCLESRNEAKHAPQDCSIDWSGRSAPERKRRATHTLRNTAPKRRSSRRVSSYLKDQGIRQVKEDRQRREANQANKTNSDRNPSHYALRERPVLEPISIEDDEGDFVRDDANVEEPSTVNGIHSSADCDDDMNYVPQLEKEYNTTRKRNATATTRPPRDVSEPNEVLSVDREEVAEEVKELSIDAPYSGPTHLIFEYPRGQKGKIRVTAEERGRLAEKKYLNDSLIDFFFKYQEIALQHRAPGLRLTAKFFSSFFFVACEELSQLITKESEVGQRMSTSFPSSSFLFPYATLTTGV
ncbi:hypothetical protein FGB62_13g040 [Gracilaria domingensis]|nr:hypothetical protein FGB62_13g040 [Gracilaria domingensis]